MRTLMQLIYRIAQHIRKAYWRVVKPRTFGAKVLVLSGEQFLLVKHSYEDGNPWTLPGGGFNPKREKVEQAAVREVREELGLSLNEVMVLDSYFSTAEHKRDTVYCITGRTDSRAIIALTGDSPCRVVHQGNHASRC
jgi:8-oxo-dGTP diphosphatase